jgi:protein-disulfide isomerase
MRKEIKILGAIAMITIIAAIAGANYYRNSIQSERQPTTTTNSSLVREDSPTLGAADAPVTIVEFLDPECESCRAFNPTIKKILKEYDGKVKLVVRYMPLHPNSLLAATYTEAAGEQGKYWQMQETLFQRQTEWGTRHGQSAISQQPNAPALFEKYAMELGLNIDKINSAVRENRYAAKLERDKKDGQSLGVRQTPTLFVNGRKLARLYEADLKSLIDEELKK